MDRKLDKILDAMSDFRSDIRTEFAGVHQNIQDLQQGQQAFEGALVRLSARMDAFEQHAAGASSAGPAQADAPKRRRHGFDDATPVRQQDSSKEDFPLRPRVTLSGFKERHTLDEFTTIIKELFGEMEGLRLSTKMLYYNSVRLEFETMQKAKDFKTKVMREKPVYAGAPLFCNFVLPWKESRHGFLARESRRQLSLLLPDATPGAIRLCPRSNTVFYKRGVALYVDDKSGILLQGPAWPEEHVWADFVLAVEGKAHG